MSPRLVGPCCKSGRVQQTFAHRAGELFLVGNVVINFRHFVRILFTASCHDEGSDVSGVVDLPSRHWPWLDYSSSWFTMDQWLCRLSFQDHVLYRPLTTWNGPRLGAGSRKVGKFAGGLSNTSRFTWLATKVLHGTATQKGPPAAVDLSPLDTPPPTPNHPWRVPLPPLVLFFRQTSLPSTSLMVAHLAVCGIRYSKRFPS